MTTIKELHTLFLSSTGVCTDTRKITKGCIFFALKGEHFNGNTFAQKALELGAAYAVIDEKKPADDDQYLLVSNVLETLQKLATAHREYLKIPIIALTGSNGKTTTKELIYAVLATQYKTTATVGNLNNHIGVPLTLLSMTSQTEIGITEIGANHQKEIEFLCTIAQPDYGYITNFGKAHLEGFGGMAGVIKGKSELYDYLRKHQKRAFVNVTDLIQVEKSSGIQQTTFSTDGAPAQVVCITKPNTTHATVIYNNQEIKTQLTGMYNAPNISAALAIGLHFNVPEQKIVNALENYIPSNSRSQLIEKNGATIILDAYNANPTSVQAALENLAQQPATHTIAFLGDMFEVGETTLKEHQAIIDLAVQLGITQVFAVGKAFAQTKVLASQVQLFDSYDAFAKAYSEQLPPNSVALIKGSRGMRMERVLELLS